MDYRIGDEVVGLNFTDYYNIKGLNGVITRLPRAKTSKRYYAMFTFKNGIQLEIPVYPDEIELRNTIVYDDTWV